jgi:hypothetical protein
LGLEKGDLKATPTTTATACHWLFAIYFL